MIRAGASRVDVLSVVLGAGTILGGFGTAFMYYETRSGRISKKRDAEVNAVIASAVHPVLQDLREIHVRMDSERDHLSSAVKAVLAEVMDPLKEQVIELRTQIGPLWKALEAQAVAAAAVLHHPLPDRAFLDGLLESFVAYVHGGPPLSAEEERTLRKLLTQIKDWEQGQDLGFPVFAGEPTAAAVMLSTMDLAMIRRHKERRTA